MHFNFETFETEILAPPLSVIHELSIYRSLISKKSYLILLKDLCFSSRAFVHLQWKIFLNHLTFQLQLLLWYHVKVPSQSFDLILIMSFLFKYRWLSFPLFKPFLLIILHKLLSHVKILILQILAKLILFIVKVCWAFIHLSIVVDHTTIRVLVRFWVHCRYI